MNIIVIIHVLILIGVFGFAAVLLHYKQEYSFVKEQKRFIVLVFLIIITLLMIFSTIALFRVPWKDILSFSL